MLLNSALISLFLSTPSARRATCSRSSSRISCLFLSTPSARRATDQAIGAAKFLQISIHALREEGDSIHFKVSVSRSLFLSTPSARRATSVSVM